MEKQFGFLQIQGGKNTEEVLIFKKQQNSSRLPHSVARSSAIGVQLLTSPQHLLCALLPATPWRPSHHYHAVKREQGQWGAKQMVFVIFSSPMTVNMQLGKRQSARLGPKKPTN